MKITKYSIDIIWVLKNYGDIIHGNFMKKIKELIKNIIKNI